MPNFLQDISVGPADEVQAGQSAIFDVTVPVAQQSLFTATGQHGYVAEKTDSNTGWLFPVGDECNELGYDHMFTDMLDALDKGTTPRESLYDGYVVNAVIDACFASIASKKWEPVQLDDWRGKTGVANVANMRDFDADHVLVKEERMPDGSLKHILRNKATGKISQRIG